MPTARDGLLDAAYAALRNRPWAGVRMVDVAAAAGVSRQTLYNEFGSKEGLAQALLRREVDEYLSGVERALAAAERSGADAGGRLTALGAWTLRSARANPLVRAVLTGCWSEELPAPHRAGVFPGPRRPESVQPVETTTEIVDKVCDRAVAALAGDWDGGPELAAACEEFTRITLSYVIAPAAKGDPLRRLAATLLSVPAGPRQLQSDHADDHQ
ncbi:TetR/AcrR family transcriptional regulator [Streptomyces sp. NPDC051940]|uniref:TetR/AcrR family transcriptional regulator n=1 Tax=Streptomyces sp. NPDC051940 TaxID=3155675 RepID=UPI00343250A5